MVEFALVLPVFLLLVLVAIDIGRVFLGWVNLQQMARVAANYAAEHASAWPDDTATIDRYRDLVANDARQINCVLPSPIPDPIIPNTALGDPVAVQINCEFHIITPVISQILGGTVLATGSAIYPVKEGAVGQVAGGGGVTPMPVAKFRGSPQSGWGGQQVKFTDQSTGSPTAWAWDFNVAPSGDGTPSVWVGGVLQNTFQGKNPPNVTYGCTGEAGQTCTFGVSLEVRNSLGTNTKQALSYITVEVPPATGPIAEFSANRTSGVKPLLVDFSFVDLRAGAVTYTSYDWDFGDGSTGTGEKPSHTYTAEGPWTVKLSVTSSGVKYEREKIGYIFVSHKVCVVPNFVGDKTGTAQATWTSNGFTTVVRFLPGKNNYVIGSQTITGGTVDPIPDGCDSTITVGPGG
jgi:PKD repeat protein